MRSRRLEIFAFTAMLFAMLALFVSLQSNSRAQGGPEGAAVPADLAAIPATFNYQGVLRQADGSLANGNYNITLRIYDQVTGGNLLHQETFNGVTVRDGVFDVVLGDAVAIQANVFADAPRYLGVTVGSDPEMIPRQRLHPVPWAVQASLALQANNAATAQQAANATTAQQANTLVTNATVNGLNVSGAFTALGELNVKVIRDVGNAAGVANRQTYDHSLRRYVVEAQDGGNSPNTVPVDDGLLVQLCGDLDGCEVTVGMRDWQTQNTGPGPLATIGPFRFSLAATRPNGQRYWDLRNQYGGNSSFWDGNGAVDHALNAYDSCYFTDGRYQAGAGSDPGVGFGLLNWSGGYTATDMVCILIIDD